VFAIESHQLTKYYHHQVALDGLSLNIPPGCTFALLGPNGAGKTTFVKSLLGLVPLKSGSIKIEGVSANLSTARAKIAFMPENFNFYPYYRVRATLNFFGQLGGLSGPRLQQQLNKTLEQVKISELANKRMDALSKGERQRVGLATLWMRDTAIYILDEPFTGLDPLMIKHLKLQIKELVDKGKTVIINSHILSEVEQIADNVAIINHGKLLACDSIEKLTANQQLSDIFCELVEGEEH
jgi:ABC-2 type transport system ATP-binding protein